MERNDNLKSKYAKILACIKKHLIISIDCVGGCIFIATFIPIFFVGALWQSILISVSINIFTSLLVLTFVDWIIDSQRKKEDADKKKARERGKILRIHKLIQQILPNYIVEFNQITIPVKRRTNEHGYYMPIDNQNFNDDFRIKDLIDFDTIDITVNGSFYDKAITCFQNVQCVMIDKLERMITEVEFNYYQNLELTVIEIINNSRNANGIKQLELISTKENREVAKIVKKGIEEYDGDPMADYLSGRFSGNALLHIINLYVYLINMRKSIRSYINEIKKIENESI